MYFDANNQMACLIFDWGTLKYEGWIKVYGMKINLFTSVFFPALFLTRTFLPCGITSEVLNSTALLVAHRKVASLLKSSTLKPGYRHKNSNNSLTQVLFHWWIWLVMHTIVSYPIRDPAQGFSGVIQISTVS